MVTRSRRIETCDGLSSRRDRGPARERRAEYLAERRKMMQAWADLLDEIATPKPKVTPIRGERA
jgi:hypothetical protein